jgi:HemY protein
MRRTLLYLLLVVAFGVLVGTLADIDPGYVLISFWGATLQTSLWVFLGGILIIGFVVLFSLKLWRGMFNTAARLQQWRKDRSLSRSIEHTSKGLLLFQEGNIDRAEKFLLSGAKNQPQPAVNYLHLAKVASRNNKPEEREKYFRLALEADKTASAAIAIARGELALEKGEFEECLDALKDAPSSERVLRIKCEALSGQQNFAELGGLLPQLKKHLGSKETLELEQCIVMATIEDAAATDDQKLAAYRSASEAVRSQPGVLIALSQMMTNKTELEAIIRKTLKKQWQPQLVEVYGNLGVELAKKRLKTALSWQKQHPVEPSLSYALGRLHEYLEQPGEAKAAYQSAVDQGGHRQASERLAALYALDGEHKKSHELLALAYRGA